MCTVQNVLAAGTIHVRKVLHWYPFILDTVNKGHLTIKDTVTANCTVLYCIYYIELCTKLPLN